MFYYDADCGFCTWAVTHLHRLTIDLECAPGRGLYIQRNAYYVDQQERVYLGARGISIALQRHGRSPVVRALGVLAGLPPAAVVYRLIAWNRHRLSKLLGRPACQI
ncbi:hypothetical protein QVA66_06105 [Staphylococcus chromogenes]|nr:hypothetical protein [Staphylococcus chromogenes]